MDDSIIVNLAYATNKNFTGSIVNGYFSNKAYMQIDALNSLLAVNQELKKQDKCLYIFDSYRPQKSVDFFLNIVKTKSKNEHLLKEKYYPNFKKEELFKKGFLTQQSSHSRASAVDLTIYDMKAKKLLDMGGIFDFFDERSSTYFTLLEPIAKKNRMLLKDIMEKYHFINYDKEWWHYRFVKEKYPDSYFDFNIEN